MIHVGSGNDNGGYVPPNLPFHLVWSPPGIHRGEDSLSKFAILIHFDVGKIMINQRMDLLFSTMFRETHVQTLRNQW